MSSPARAPLPRRYISAQAYYHALRAAVAEAQGDLPQAAEALQLALVYDHESLHLTLELGRVSLAQGRVARAAKMAEQARRLDPGSIPGALLAAQVEQARDRPEAAERVLRRAERREVSGVDAALALARLLVAAGRGAEAAPVLRRAAERAPQEVEALALLARVERDAGRLDVAAQALRRAVDRASGQRALRVELTDVLERQGDLAAAAAQWADYLERRPGDQAALVHAARVELLLDGEADELLERLRHQTRSPDDQRRLGMMLARSGRPAEGAALLGGLPKPSALDAKARLVWGLALEASGKEDAALAALEPIGPDAGPVYLRARVTLAEIHLGAGRPRRARQAAQAALTRLPDSAPLLGLMATLHARAGELQDGLRLVADARARGIGGRALVEAEAELLTRLEGPAAALVRMQALLRTEGPAGKVAALVASARAHRALGDDARAEAALEDAEKEASTPRERADADLALGAHALDTGARPGQAVRWMRAALAQAPRDPAVLSGLGRALLAAGDVEHARTFSERAARLSPRDPKIMEQLGDLQRIAGMPAEARTAYRAALKGLDRAVRSGIRGATEDRARVRAELAGLEGR